MLNATSARWKGTGKIKIDKCRFSTFFLTFFRFEGRKKYLERKKMLFSGQGQKIESSFFSELISKKTDRIGFREKNFGGKIVSDRFTTNQLVIKFLDNFLLGC